MVQEAAVGRRKEGKIALSADTRGPKRLQSPTLLDLTCGRSATTTLEIGFPGIGKERSGVGECRKDL